MKIKNLIGKAKRKLVGRSLAGLTLLTPLNFGCVDRSYEDVSVVRYPPIENKVTFVWKNYDSRGRLIDHRERWLDLTKDSLTSEHNYHDLADFVIRYQYKGKSNTIQRKEVLKPRIKEYPLTVVWEMDDNEKMKVVFRDFNDDGKNDLEDLKSK